MRDLVACPPNSGMPASPSLFLLEPINDPIFPLSIQEAPSVLNLVLVVQDSPKPVVEQNDALVE